MDWDDLDPKTKKPKPRNLDDVSVDALHEYIADLEAEIERVKGEIAKKKAAIAGAEAFFKK